MIEVLYNFFIDPFVRMAADFPIFFAEIVISGLLAGVMYSLVALGFVLIFKASGVFNFAQGVMALFAGLFLTGFMNDFGIPAWLAIPMTVAVMIATAWLIERLVLSHLVNQEPIILFMATLGLAYVLMVRGFTRIDVTFRVLPPMARAMLHALAYLTLAGLAAFFAWKAASEWHETWLFDAHANTPLQTPLWIPQGLWAIGMSVFALSAVIHALRALLLLSTAPPQVEAEYGLLQIEDELKDYRQSSLTGTPPAPGS